MTLTPGKHNYKSVSEKKETDSEKAKKHRAMAHNARRRGAGGNLTRGYMKMPKDHAIFQPWTGTCVPTILKNKRS